MPRFGTRSLLVAFAIAAVWLSTFSGYWAAQDVRRSILLLILVASESLALYSRGRRRAFWSAFAIVMFVCGGLSYERPLYRYVPDFVWMDTLQALNPYPPSPNYYNSYAPLAAPQPVYSVPATAPTPADPDQPQQAPPLAVPPTPAPPPLFQAAPPAPPGLTIREALNDTFAAAWTLGLAAIAGFIAAYIFNQRPISASDSR
jgi:hypothetical protein